MTGKIRLRDGWRLTNYIRYLHGCPPIEPLPYFDNVKIGTGIYLWLVCDDQSLNNYTPVSFIYIDHFTQKSARSKWVYLLAQHLPAGLHLFLDYLPVRILANDFSINELKMIGSPHFYMLPQGCSSGQGPYRETHIATNPMAVNSVVNIWKTFEATC
jgi:hypothetical protein